jgi:hypothetical protein
LTKFYLVIAVMVPVVKAAGESLAERALANDRLKKTESELPFKLAKSGTKGRQVKGKKTAHKSRKTSTGVSNMSFEDICLEEGVAHSHRQFTNPFC